MRRAPASAPNTASTKPSCAQSELRARLGARRLEVGAGDRAPDDLVARRPLARERVGEEDAVGERRRPAVGEAEVRIGLGEHARDAERARGQQHRPRHEAAAAEHGMRPAPAQDARAGDRRGRRPARAPGRAAATGARGRPLTSKGSNGVAARRARAAPRRARACPRRSPRLRRARAPRRPPAPASRGRRCRRPQPAPRVTSPGAAARAQRPPGPGALPPGVVPPRAGGRRACATSCARARRPRSGCAP